MVFDLVKKNLESRGYTVRTFSTGANAAAYLNGKIDGTTVGIGSSLTVHQTGLYDMLISHNEVYSIWTDGSAALEKSVGTRVYITSANGLAETGEIINIDARGNRVASTLYGHDKVYFMIGRNKLAPTYEAALWRARNIASPKNAQRLGKKTPCAVKADRCYDCKSPDRICRGLVVLWAPVWGMETEILLVDEDLGL